MRSTMVVVLASLLIVQSVDAQQVVPDNRIKQSIAALPAKAHVELQLADGNADRGRIVSRAEHDFAFRQDNGGQTQTISYDQVRSVSQIKGGHSKTKWIIIGVVAGAAVVVAIIAIVAVKHPLGSGPGF